MPLRPGAARRRACALLVVLATGLSACGGGAAVVAGPVDLAPHADAGVDTVGRVNVLLTLDGTASSDPEGGALTFRWVQTQGPAATLSDPLARRPTFVPTVADTYVFEVRVTDPAGTLGPPDEVVVIVIDDLAATPRRAPAAVPRAAGLEHSVFLDAAPSFAGGLPTVVLADGSVRNVVLVDLAADASDDPAPGDVAGRLRIVVVVGPAVFATLYAERLPGDEDPAHLDLGGGSTPSVVAFAVVGKPFVLDGSLSIDDQTVSSWTWTQVGGPFKFTTQDGQVDAVVDAPGHYEFELTVTDNIGLSSFASRLRVPVVPALQPAVGPPDARATLTGAVVVGNDDTPTVALAGTTLVLSGAGSTSRNGGTLTFSWEQVAGPPARFGSASGDLVSVVPPAAGTYVFALQVTDENGSAAVQELALTVAVPGSPPPTPALEPIPDQVLDPVAGPPLVVLDGTQSSGAGPLTFRWRQTQGMPVFVENAATGRGSVVPPAAGLYEFELSVFDGTSLSAPVRRSFRVR